MEHKIKQKRKKRGRKNKSKATMNRQLYILSTTQFYQKTLKDGDDSLAV